MNVSDGNPLVFGELSPHWKETGTVKKAGKRDWRREEDAFTIFPVTLGWEPVLGNRPSLSGKKNVCSIWFCL